MLSQLCPPRIHLIWGNIYAPYSVRRQNLIHTENGDIPCRILEDERDRIECAAKILEFIEAI
jgi:hypothetical protein